MAYYEQMIVEIILLQLILQRENKILVRCLLTFGQFWSDRNRFASREYCYLNIEISFIRNADR